MRPRLRRFYPPWRSRWRSPSRIGARWRMRRGAWKKARNVRKRATCTSSGLFRAIPSGVGSFKHSGMISMEGIAGWERWRWGRSLRRVGRLSSFTPSSWWDPEANEEDRRDGREFVLKVFKKGTFLKHLKSQLPLGLLQFHAEEMENLKSSKPFVLLRYYCNVLRGTLLKDGRFAFLMEKEHLDLCNLIEREVKLRSGQKHGPFSKEDGELIMYYVALGVNWLHGRGIVHRDLKASNVLVQEVQSVRPKWRCFVADYECSVGVVGTGFFRAPEILQALKDWRVSQNPEVFSRAADVYSYGMTCYEILTGKLPFEDHPLSGDSCLLTDLVINQHLRPEVPDYVEDWTHDLLTRCWQSNHAARPTFEEILDLLSANSATIRNREGWQMEKYGENFRMEWYRTEIPNS